MRVRISPDLRFCCWLRRSCIDGSHRGTTATRRRRGVTTEYCVPPLSRRRSARSAEDREVLVRFQGVARRCIASVAQLAECSVLTREVAGANPAGGTHVRTRPLGAALSCQGRPDGFESRRPLHRPRSTKVVPWSRKPLGSVRFRPRARMSCSSNRQETGFSIRQHGFDARTRYDSVF